MNYTETEKNAVRKTYEWRQKILAPILKFLSSAGVTANRITYFRALLGLLMLYELFIVESFPKGVLVYFINYLLDGLDGALARYTQTTSDKGKFNDVIVDQLTYALFILGLAFLSVGNVFFLFFHVIVSGAVYLLAIIYKNQNKPTDWLIHPEPNLMYLKIIATAPVLLYLFFKINLIDLTIFALNSWMTVLAVYYFIALQKAPYNRIKN